jgi:hypothetical protein
LAPTELGGTAATEGHDPTRSEGNEIQRKNVCDEKYGDTLKDTRANKYGLINMPEVFNGQRRATDTFCEVL